MKERKLESLNRRAPRRVVEFGAFAERPDGSEAVLTVANLSYEGCQLNSGENFLTGERVKLNLPRRGEILAEIRWSAEGKAGANFIVNDGTSK